MIEISKIVEKLLTKSNYKIATELCIQNNIDISLKNCPEINIYYYNDDDDAEWFEVGPNTCEFYVYGISEKLKGTNNFFKYYNKIHTFLFKGKGFVETVRVKYKGWNEHTDDNHYEIFYEYHSETSPAYENTNKHEKIEPKYYLDGNEVSKKQIIFKTREKKLDRIIKRKK